MSGFRRTAGAGSAAGSSNDLYDINYLQSAADRRHTLHFTDVTGTSGIPASGHGMGVATFDYNNDGCIDPYVTNKSLRNSCKGSPEQARGKTVERRADIW